VAAVLLVLVFFTVCMVVFLQIGLGSSPIREGSMGFSRDIEYGSDVPLFAQSFARGVTDVPFCEFAPALINRSRAMMRQTVRYLTTPDGVRLAWATSGTGPELVKTANWITHLEYDWESPVWRHWTTFLSEHFHLTRYDERGNGLSQHDVADVSPRNWVADLTSVTTARKCPPPFALLGISQGTVAAIEYASLHPDQVSHLIIYGGYARGWGLRDNPDDVRRMRAIIELTELGWGRAEPVFRRLFTARFIPEGSEEQLHWFDELCAKTTSPRMASRLLASRGEADVRHLLSSVRVPTLVLHGKDDQCVPFAEGQAVAAGIPGAEFVQLDSRNHILLEHEPAWHRFKEAVLDFTGVRSRAEDAVFGTLSLREREILSQLVAGRSNGEIGGVLFISEKTVRNHVTSIFEKLGVSTRAQAIVFARDRHFDPSSASKATRAAAKTSRDSRRS
jgi:pimeloyl-ACP methyl ester carboxylesterase/DNA-binding CsgD family transcriptional regulator